MSPASRLIDAEARGGKPAVLAPPAPPPLPHPDPDPVAPPGALGGGGGVNVCGGPEPPAPHRLALHRLYRAGHPRMAAGDRPPTWWRPLAASSRWGRCPSSDGPRSTRPPSCSWTACSSHEDADGPEPISLSPLCFIPELAPFRGIAAAPVPATLGGPQIWSGLHPVRLSGSEAPHDAQGTQMDALGFGEIYRRRGTPGIWPLGSDPATPALPPSRP